MKRHIRKASWYIEIFPVGVFVLMNLTAGPLQAQEMHSITIGEAIRIALENNLELKRSSNQVVAGELSVRQAKADFYPNLNALANERVKTRYNLLLNRVAMEYVQGEMERVVALFE